jgi:CPA2 family monovalent cation:H+ antiporter-2
MEASLFKDLITILALSIFVLLVGYRLRLPPVVGFILTGVLAGPHGFGFVEDIEDVDKLAQIGIVLLLFGIGMEFSFKKLIQIKHLFLMGGSLQVGLTILLSFFAGQVIGSSWGESIFLGCLLSLSSTAIVLRLLEQQGETASPQGKLSISVLIFQDLIAIPMILLTPFLGQEDSAAESSTSVWLLIKGIAIMIIVFLSAQRLVPRLMLLVARTRNKELFLLTVLALCFGVAWMTSNLGLSLTIGAFLAGLIISESEYSNEAISHIFPFQALFISFFFVSIGMLLDINFVLAQPFIILGLTVLVVALKVFTGGVATLLLGMPIRTAILVGVSLSQIGEFSFVLAKTGIPYGLGSEYYYQLFLAVSLFTLATSPLLVNLSIPFANWVMSFPIPDKIKMGFKPLVVEQAPKLENHIIIVGFGISGQNLARSSKLAGVPYTILEMNPDTVKEQRKAGEPIHFGDATHLAVLEHSNLNTAKAVAILINDPIASKRIVKIVREAHPSVYIIVRVRYVQEMSLFAKLGADEVIPDEFGTSIEVFSRVLKQYYVPQEEIENFINEIRSDGYEKLRTQTISANLSEIKLDLAGIEMHSLRLSSFSPLVGKSLFESELRKSHGISVLLIRRGAEIITNPLPDIVLLADDIIVFLGKMPSTQLRELFGRGKVELSPAIA